MGERSEINGLTRLMSWLFSTYGARQVLVRQFLTLQRLVQNRDEAPLAFKRRVEQACMQYSVLALHALKDLEHRVMIEAEALDPQMLPREFPAVGPRNVKGIEINPYAAELARVTVWIGEIQWMRRNGFDVSRNPILKPLDTIECRDAIINEDGTAANWPPADVIIGNPPYLGAKLMKRRLGVPMTEAIRRIYQGRLPGFTDLICYWFENSRQLIQSGVVARAGLVATNSIRKNTNLPVMHRIAKTTRIYAAWPEEQWTVDGAAVDVSLICFGNNGGATPMLKGEPAPIYDIDPLTRVTQTPMFGASEVPHDPPVRQPD
jgi:hypothetical protein